MHLLCAHFWNFALWMPMAWKCSLYLQKYIATRLMQWYMHISVLPMFYLHLLRYYKRVSHSWSWNDQPSWHLELCTPHLSKGAHHHSHWSATGSTLYSKFKTQQNPQLQPSWDASCNLRLQHLFSSARQDSQLFANSTCPNSHFTFCPNSHFWNMKFPVFHPKWREGLQYWIVASSFVTNSPHSSL